MSEPIDLWAAPMETIRDNALLTKLRPFIDKKRHLVESNLQKVRGAPIYVWYGNSRTSVVWHPISEPIFYEAKS